MTVKGLSGQRYQLEAKAFSSGGEGDIFAIIGKKDRVVKIYHSDRVSNELEAKLKTMVQRPPSSSVLSQVAWPLDVVYDDSGNFCGFVMPRLSINAELGEIYAYPPKTNITYQHKIILAQNICVVISEVHKAGYVFGDFNPRNIGINTNTGAVAFLDTDSYHFSDSNKTYRCKVCLDGYVAPELLKKCEAYANDAYANAPLPTFTNETDNFSLAIHIFKLLMNGFTPYNGIKESQRASTASPGVGNQAVKRDEYCFKPGNKPLSAAVPKLDVHPKEIADLFTRAFIDGKNNPKKRPTAIEWYNALNKYESLLVNCKDNKTHFYRKQLKKCPWCEADKKYQAALSQPSQPTQPIIQKSFSTPITQTAAPKIVQGTPSVGSSNISNRGSTTSSGYQSGIASKPTPTIVSPAVRDDRKKTINKLYKISWVVYILYTILMNYIMFFKHSYLVYEMNVTLSTLAYLCIIGGVSYLSGLNESGFGIVFFPTLFLYVADYSYVIGVVIIENYLYRHVVNGIYESMIIQLLGVSQWFVWKYIGLSLLISLGVTAIPAYLGGLSRNRLLSTNKHSNITSNKKKKAIIIISIVAAVIVLIALYMRSKSSFISDEEYYDGIYDEYDYNEDDYDGDDYDEEYYDQNGEPIEEAIDDYSFYGIWCFASRDYESAELFSEELIDNGYDAFVCLSTEWSELNSEPWYVVTAGEYYSEEEAKEALDDVHRIVPDAYIGWTGNYTG